MKSRVTNVKVAHSAKADDCTNEASLPVSRIAHEGDEGQPGDGHERQRGERHIEGAVLHHDVQVRVDLRQQRGGQQDPGRRKQRHVEPDGPTSLTGGARGLHEGDDSPAESARAGRAPAQSDSLLAHSDPAVKGQGASAVFERCVKHDDARASPRSSVLVRSRVRRRYSVAPRRAHGGPPRDSCTIRCSPAPSWQEL